MHAARLQAVSDAISALFVGGCEFGAIMSGGITGNPTGAVGGECINLEATLTLVILGASCSPLKLRETKISFIKAR